MKSSVLIFEHYMNPVMYSVCYSTWHIIILWLLLLLVGAAIVAVGVVASATTVVGEAEWSVHSMYYFSSFS